jgi:hypothetical protein
MNVFVTIQSGTSVEVHPQGNPQYSPTVQQQSSFISNLPVFQTGSQGASIEWVDSSYYPRNNPSGFATGIDSSAFVRRTESGQFYPISNPSGFATGIDSSNFVLKSQTGIFALSGHSHTGYLLNSLTGNFYSSDNPSGFITGIDLSSYITGSVIRPNQTGIFYLSSNPSGFITGLDLSSYVTGSVVRPTQTGIFITSFQTGLFYPLSNPSGFATGVDVSNLVSKNQTGQFYSVSNPSGFITGINLSSYITGSVVRPTETGNFITNFQTGLFYPLSNPSGFITGINTGNFVTGSVIRPNDTGIFVSIYQTGQFSSTGWIDNLYYPRSNPSGFGAGGGVTSGWVDSNYYPRSNPSGYGLGGGGGPLVNITVTGYLNIADTGNNQELISISGNINNYIEINCVNYNTGNKASSDLVVSNSSNEAFNYVNLGINSSNYTGEFVGYSGDGYLYSAANDFYIGNVATGKNIYFFFFLSIFQPSKAIMSMSITGVSISGSRVITAADTGNFGGSSVINNYSGGLSQSLAIALAIALG